MHGTEVRKWIGKKIKIRAEKVRAFGKVWDALRVVDEGEPSDNGLLHDPVTGEVAGDPEPGHQG
jgi:hypothetical protein